MKKYPASGVWDERRRGRLRLNLRIPARVAKVCNLKQGVRVEWRFYKTGANKFRATIQQVSRIAAVVLLLCVVDTNGQPLPDNPTPHISLNYVYHQTGFGGTAKHGANYPTFNRTVFFTGIGLLAAAKTADAVTTRLALDRGFLEYNSVFGRQPSPARQAGINAGFFVLQSGIFFVTEHNRHKWVRWSGRALLGTTIANHVQLAACNSGINMHTPQACHSIPGF